MNEKKKPETISKHHDGNDVNNTEENITNREKDVNFWQSLKYLFDLNNIREVWNCTKSSSNNGSIQIWLILVVHTTFLIAYFGTSGVLFQFSEKVYGWNAAEYSNANAITSIINIIVWGLALGSIVRLLKSQEIILALIGITSFAFGCILRGSIENQFGFYLSSVFIALNCVIPIGTRSK